MATSEHPAGHEIPAFRGHAPANPEEEFAGTGNALARAIAEAAMEAAKHIGEPKTFEVSRIQITVSPNPGPTSYNVTITA